MNLYNLFESADTDKKIACSQFIKFAKQSLGIKQLPKIKMVRTIAQSEHPTFGLFDPNTNTISVAYADRHIMDVLRTLGHELTHHKQREDNRIKPDSGETGSDIENEANAQAGVLMRDFADRNPGLFDNKKLDEMLDPGDNQVGDTTIKITKHALQRIEDRGIPLSTAKEMLNRISSMSSDFPKLPKDAPFWIHDESLNISLGFQWSVTGVLTWTTAIMGDAHAKGRYQVFDIQ